MNLEITTIVWEDSYGAHSGWQSIEDYKPVQLRIVSVGFVISETDQVVALAPNYADATAETFKQANGIMVIPKSAILNRVEIPISVSDPAIIVH